MSSSTKTFLAVDLGAGSGRVIAGRYDGATLVLETLNRFDNTPVEIAGHIHWNVPALLTGIREGIAKALAEGAEPASVGVDTWGVDYGLLDKDGRLLGLPYAYRDARNDGSVDAFCSRVGGRRPVYAQTGIQFMDFNTLFQLDVESRSGDPLPPKADRLLMMPDLMNFWLSGVAANEATIASTSNAIDLSTRTWAWNLLDAAGAPRHLFRDPVRPGTVLGPVRGFGGAGFPVVTVGGHDTASAVASVPANPSTKWGYLATGTWALMGVLIDTPLANDESFALNYTHEGGVAGDFRFLKNITGMWLLQELRRDWKRLGRDLSYAEIERLATESAPFARFIDPDEPAFAAPGDMAAKFADFCRRTGQTPPATEGEAARAAYEGLVLRYREVWGELERLTGVRREVLHMVGGATRDALHCQLAADALGIPVVCGPVEGTAYGNILAQLVASGDIASFDEGRALVGASVSPTVYEPKNTAPWDDAFARWRAVREAANGKA